MIKYPILVLPDLVGCTIWYILLDISLNGSFSIDLLVSARSQETQVHRVEVDFGQFIALSSCMIDCN